jgi:hypothetical protein
MRMGKFLTTDQGKQVSYTGEYKYQNWENFGLYLPPTFALNEKLVYNPGPIYIVLTSEGFLSISKGYAWDGPSGPVKDTPENMRASLVHDALYQLIRQKILPASLRKAADKVFRKMCVHDGVPQWQAWTWYYGLRWLGSAAASPKNRKLIMVAPV